MDIRTNEFEFTPKRCEEIDACIKVPCDPRGVISGRVLDCCNKPIKNATLKLFEKTCKDELCPITHTFTDEDGFFLFGPLCPCATYVIKIFIEELKNKKIAIDKCKCARDMDCLECDFRRGDPCKEFECRRDRDCDCRCDNDRDCDRDRDCDCRCDNNRDFDCDCDDEFEDFECKCRRKHSCKENRKDKKECKCREEREEKKECRCRDEREEKKECCCREDRCDWKRESRKRKCRRNRCECGCGCFDECDF